MVKARDNGLIGGIGLSNITREHLVHALAITGIACVQNPMNLADRHSLPVLEECQAQGIAFVPFFPLGSAFAGGNPVLRSPQVASIAARLGRTRAQVALAWLLSFGPNILLIPGTSSVSHLEETWPSGSSSWTRPHARSWPRRASTARHPLSPPVPGPAGGVATDWQLHIH